jgi:hypothetical protein
MPGIAQGLTLAADRTKFAFTPERPESFMQWFRTMAVAIRLLVALFLVAQFAGVVSSPLAQAHAAAAIELAQASHLNAHSRLVHGHHADSHRSERHHVHGHRHAGCAHPAAGTCADPADFCCALHAFFAGILPPAATLDNPVVAAEIVGPAVNDIGLGLHPARLDRPPRPLS